MLKSGLYNIVGAIIRMALAVLSVPLLIQFIGLTEYGLWTLVYAAAGLVGLIESGLSVSTTVFVSRDLAGNDHAGMAQTLTAIAVTTLALSILVALPFWFGASTIATLLPSLDLAQRSVAVRALQLSGFVIALRLILQVLIGVEQAYQRFGALNILYVLQSLLTNGGMIVVASQGGIAIQLMQWNIAATAVMLVAHTAMVWTLLRAVPLRPSWNLQRGIVVGRHTAVTWMTMLGGTLFSQVDRLIIGALLGTRTLGVYAAITNITTQINAFSSVPVQPLLPTVSNLSAAADGQPALVQRVRQAVQINSFVAFGLGAALFALAPLIIQIMVPEALNSESILVLQLATVIYSLYSLNAVGYFILLSKHIVYCMLITIVSAVFSLSLVALGARNFGLVGAILGNAGYISTFVMNNIAAQRLQIPQSSLLKWTWFPFAWFATTIGTQLLLANNQYVGLPILSLQLVIFALWFFTAQEINIVTFYNRLVSGSRAK